MDTTQKYRNLIKQTLCRYARLRPSHGDIRLDTVFDDEQGHYALMQVGWDRGRRVRGNLIYITISDDKIHIEYDGLEHGIMRDLTAQNIPEENIVLSFLRDAAA